MKTMKRIVAVAILLSILLVCTVGCTPEDDTTTTAPNTDGSSGTADTTTGSGQPAHVHNYSALIYEEDATCSEAGCKSHYTCFGCDAVFDEEKKEVSPESLVISALGHDFDDAYKCTRCKLKLGEVVEAIAALPDGDNITLSALSAIGDAISKYNKLDDAAKDALNGLTDKVAHLLALSEQIEGIEVGVMAKYLSDAGQNQTLTDVKWTDGADEIYGNYKQIDYSSWQWVNLKYNSSTRPEGKTVVMFVYNASDADVELTWGAVDPAKTGCIFNIGVGWTSGNGEDPDVGHQVLKAKSWNMITIKWDAIYGFNANIMTTGHYADAENKAPVNGWKFSDVYMMEADKLPLMQQIIDNSVGTSAE